MRRFTISPKKNNLKFGYLDKGGFLTKHCFQNLPQHCHDLPPEPLVSLSQVKHLIHEEQDDSQRDVVDGRVVLLQDGANLAGVDGF